MEFDPFNANRFRWVFNLTAERRILFE